MQHINDLCFLAFWSPRFDTVRKLYELLLKENMSMYVKAASQSFP